LARTKPPAERRSDLISAALKIFEKKGYSKATVSEIVKAAGVAQGTFYLYFDSKEDVLDAVAEHIVRDIVDVAIDISRSDRTAVEKVQELLRAWLNVLGASRGPLLEELHGSKYAPLHDRMARKALERMLPPLISIIEQGVAEGSMDVPYPEVTALNWVSVNFPTEVSPVGVSLSFDQMMEAYIDFVCRLLGFTDPKVFDDLVTEARSKVRPKAGKYTR
jgi:AcrR family transcriptional regulator